MFFIVSLCDSLPGSQTILHFRIRGKENSAMKQFKALQQKGHIQRQRETKKKKIQGENKIGRRNLTILNIYLSVHTNMFVSLPENESKATSLACLWCFFSSVLKPLGVSSILFLSCKVDLCVLFCLLTKRFPAESQVQ